MAQKSGIDFEIAQFIVRYTPAWRWSAAGSVYIYHWMGFRDYQSSKQTHLLPQTSDNKKCWNPICWLISPIQLGSSIPLSQYFKSVLSTKPWKQWQIIREIHCRHRFLESHQVRVWFKVSIQNSIKILGTNGKTFWLYPFTDSAFKQQRLPAWQPILTAGTVLPTFFIIGVAFIPIGIGLLHFSNNVKYFDPGVQWTEIFYISLLSIGERVCLWLHRLHQPREFFLVMCKHFGNEHNQSLYLCPTCQFDGHIWSKFHN